MWPAFPLACAIISGMSPKAHTKEIVVTSQPQGLTDFTCNKTITTLCNHQKNADNL
jgi:hypothetical protein